MKTAAIVVWAIVLGVVVGSVAQADSAKVPGPRVGVSGTIGPVCARKADGVLRFIQLGQHCRKGEKFIYLHVRFHLGRKGLRGPTGPKGRAGVAGATGAQGVAGAQGTQGPPGAKGPTGPQGVAGQKGATGPSGPMGSQGPSGPQGPTGPSGSLEGAQIVYACVNDQGNSWKWGGPEDGTPDCDPGHGGLIIKVVTTGVFTPPS